MMNRPGRLYYLLEFHGLDQDFIKEYCEDNLQRKDYIQAVLATAALFRSFNFDMLKAMVEDMNRYDESPSEVLKFLNVRLDSGGNEKFAVKLVVEGKPVKAQKNWSGSPVSDVIRIYTYPEGDDESEKNHYFSAKNLQKLDPKSRVFRFQNDAGVVLTLTPVPTTKISFDFDNIASSSIIKTPSVGATCDEVSVTEEENYAAMMGDY